MYKNYVEAVDVNPELCTTIAMEECAEFIQAISKAKRGKLNYDNLTEEIADVLISIKWVTEIYSVDFKDVEKWKAKKEKRVVERLNKGKFD